MAPPYKHSTTGPLVGHQWTATPWWPAASYPQGGTEVGCNAGLRRAATSWWPDASHPLGDKEVGCKVGFWWVVGGWQPLHLLLSSSPPLCLLIFSFTGFGLQQPT